MKITPHPHQTHVEDRSALLHDVRVSIYVYSSTRNWNGKSMMTLILREELYLRFRPLKQGLLQSRAKSHIGNILFCFLLCTFKDIFSFGFIPLTVSCYIFSWFL